MRLLEALKSHVDDFGTWLLVVTHYVEAHGYAPPAEFVSAVLACPVQSSDEFVAWMEPFLGMLSLDRAEARYVAEDSRKRREDCLRDIEEEQAKKRFAW